MKKILFLFLILINGCTIINNNTPNDDNIITTIFMKVGSNLTQSKTIRDNLFDLATESMYDDSTYQAQPPYEPETIIRTSKFYLSILNNQNNKGKDYSERKLAFVINGGAFYHTLRNTHKKLYGDIFGYSKENDFDVILIRYEPVPDKNYPYQLNQIQDAWEYLLKKGYNEKNIVLIGDSAGGNLVLAHTLRLRDNNKTLPRALVLLSPWTDLTNTTESREFNKYRDIVMGTSRYSSELGYPDKFINNQYGRNDDLKNPYISPIYADYKNFPTTIIEVGSYEMLWDDSYKIYQNMKKNNVDVYFKDYEAMFHVFQFLPYSTQAEASKKRIIKIIEETFKNEKK